MKSKILVTFFSRFGSAAAGFYIAILLSQFLGAEGKGQASLLILNISFINLLTNVMGGAALVYLVPRFHTFTLFLVSYIWVPLAAMAIGFVYYLTGFNVQGFDIHTILLAIILGWFHTNTNILLGKQKTHTYNILTVIQVFITLLYLLFAFYGQQIAPHSYSQYVTALYAGYGLSFVASLFFTLKEIDTRFEISELKEVLYRFIRHGGFIQLANLGQLLIYRTSFYIIGYYHSLKALGIYSNAIALAESIWIVSRSIATIQYAEIAVEKDINVSKQKTMKLRKTNVFIAIGLAAIICILPDTFYTFLFGRDFKGLQQIIWYLAPGIIAFAYANITTHFFSGIGKNHYNTIISFAGFGVTAIAGFILIPVYSGIGAAITASIVYIFTAVLANYMFIKTNKIQH
jgi:O-antigen/teichoic acid export membrane protein